MILTSRLLKTECATSSKLKDRPLIHSRDDQTSVMVYDYAELCVGHVLEPWRHSQYMGLLPGVDMEALVRPL